MKKILIGGKEFDYTSFSFDTRSLTNFYKGTEEVEEAPLICFWKPVKKIVRPKCIFSLPKNIEKEALTQDELKYLEFILNAIQ